MLAVGNGVSSRCPRPSDAACAKPGGDLVRIEADQTTDLVVRHSLLGDETADVADSDAEALRNLSSLKEGLVSRAPDGFLSGSVAARRAGGFVLGRVEARAVKGRPEAEREPERQRRLAATLEGPVIGHRHTGRRPLGLRGSALSIPMWGVLVPPAAVRRRCGLSPGPVDAGGQARGPGCRSSLRRGGAAWSVSAAAWRAQSSGRPRRR